MAKISPTTMRGLLVPDPRISTATIDAADSSYSQASPRPGVPEPQNDTGMVLQASGTQSAASALRVQAVRGGYPERDGAAFVWRQSGDTSWRGWETPNTISAIEVPRQPSGALDEYRHPHACVNASDGVVVATCEVASGLAKVEVSRRTSAGNWSTLVEVHSEDADGTNEPHPCLLALPSGRLLCLFFTYDATASVAQLKVRASDDNGATWADYARAALDTPIDTSTYTIERARAAYQPITGQTLLVIERSGGTRLGLVQYASDDLCASFVTVSTQPGTSASAAETTANARTSGCNHDVAALPGGGFILIYQPDWTAAVPKPYQHVLDSAYRDLWGDWPEVVKISDFTFTSANYQYLELTLAPAPDGAIYLYALGIPLIGTDVPAGEVLVSYDSGVTWTLIGAGPGGASARWFQTSAGSPYPTEIHAVWQRGRVVMASNFDANGATTPDADALVVRYLGGYSATTLPSVDYVESPTNQIAWGYVYEPTELPSGHASPLSVVSTGAPTQNVTSYIWTVTTANGENLYIRATPSGSSLEDTGIIGEAEIAVTSGLAEVRIRLDDGATTSVECGIRLSTTTCDVWDYEAAAAVTSSTSLAVAQGTLCVLRIAVASGKVYAAVCTTPRSEDREFSILANGLTLTNGGGSSAERVVEAGRIQTVGASAFTLQRFAHDAATVIRYAAGQTNPDELRGRPLSVLPVYVDDGVRVAAVDGPCAAGDTWHIDTRYDYAIDHLHPREYPSPQVGWRATAGGTQQIAWALDPDDGGELGHGLWGLYLAGCNCPSIRVQYEDSPGAGWTTAATVDTRTAFAAVVEGGTVRPAESGATVAGPYIEAGELVGGSIEFSNGDVRTIVRNTAGVLTSGTTIAERRCVIYLDSNEVDGGEAGGACYVRHPDAMILLHHLASGNTVSGLRVALDYAGTSNASPEGYWKIDKLAIGPVYVFGWDYSATRRQRIAANVDLQTGLSGVRRSRVLGPARRAVELSWTEGVDLTTVRGTQQDDYVVSTSTSGADPVASRREAPSLLRGLYDELDGSHVPVVYLPYIAAGTPNAAALTWQRCRGAMYGRIVGELTLETLLGDDEVDELVRCAITIEEEV